MEPGTERDPAQAQRRARISVCAACTKLAAGLTNKSPGDWNLAARGPGGQLQLKLLFSFSLGFNTSNTYLESDSQEPTPPRPGVE